MTPMNEIVYENLRSWEMNLVNFMGYNLNLNGDKINRFGQKSNPNEGGHMARRGPHIQLKLKLGKKRN